MKRAFIACLIGAALVSGHLRLTAAETANLRHVMSIYFDQKEAGFKQPEGVACDARGRVIVADTGNGRLVRFNLLEGKLGGGDEIRLPQITAPSLIHVTSKGDLCVLDGKQRRIVRLGPDGEFKAVLAFDGAPPPATIVLKSFAIDAFDNVYALDVFSGRVLMLDARGRFQRALSLPADAGFIADVTVDTTGTVFLLDSIKRRLYWAAKDAAEFSRLGGDLTQQLGTMPSSLTASKGMLFIAEGSGSSIITFGRDGSFLSRQLKPGWEEGTLNYPSQVCINDRDEVFIADRDNSRIQVFRLVR